MAENYEELLKALACCQDGVKCDECPYYSIKMVSGMDTCLDTLINRSYIAVSTFLAQKQKPAKPKPPKRIPCICGRKQIGSHWFDTKERRYFLKCPACGLESKHVKYQTELNQAWNEAVMTAVVAQKYMEEDLP